MDWDIIKTAKKCSDTRCNAAFKDQEEFFSALYENGEKFNRRDFCLECWDNSANDKQQPFSFWKSKLIKKITPSKPTVNTEAVFDLFFKLQSENEDKSKINLRYVLALFLTRGKTLKFKSTKIENGNDFLVLYYPEEDKYITLLYNKLTEDDINDITNEVKILLGNYYSVS